MGRDMKKRLIWLLMFVALVAFSAQVYAAKITMCEDPWPPYTVGEMQEEATGVAVDLIKAVYGKMGHEASVILLPWKRCLQQVESGKIDAIAIALWKDSRAETYMYPEYAFDNRTGVWYSPERFPDGLKWEKMEDLEKYTLELVKGYSVSEAMDEAVKSGKQPTSWSTKFDLMVKKLIAGRADFGISNEVVMYDHLRRNDLKGKLVPTDNPFKTSRYHISIFSRNSPNNKLVPELNKTLAEMRASGEIDKIVFGN